MSDLEYRDKYLKYKAKYLNLKDMLDEQDGGVHNFLKKAATAVTSGAKAVGTAVTSGAKAVLGNKLSEGEYIIFLNGIMLDKLPDNLKLLEIKNHLVVIFNDFIKIISTNFWYYKVSKKSSTINKNDEQSNVKLENLPDLLTDIDHAKKLDFIEKNIKKVKEADFQISEAICNKLKTDHERTCSKLETDHGRTCSKLKTDNENICSNPTAEVNTWYGYYVKVNKPDKSKDTDTIMLLYKE